MNFMKKLAFLFAVSLAFGFASHAGRQSDYIGKIEIG